MNHKFPIRAISLIAVLAIVPPSSFSDRLRLTPRLRVGQTLFYRVDVSSTRDLKTESRVISPQLPPAAKLAFSGLLQVEVLEAGASGFRLKTYLSEPPAPPAYSSPPAKPNSLQSADKSVEVSIAADGSASQTKDLDQLSPSQRFAWSSWLGSFTSSLTYPQSSLHLGQKWESIEPEASPSPIAELSWQKQYQYVRDEPCDDFGNSSSAKSGGKSDVCAAVLVRATLRQKSSPKNATPQDYKLHNLKTIGTASGQNETILYFSHSTGLLMHATEDAQQHMNVVIALSDGSNQVHYNLTAKSHSEIQMLRDSPQDVR
jgi:hypothetical protein